MVVLTEQFILWDRNCFKKIFSKNGFTIGFVIIWVMASLEHKLCLNLMKINLSHRKCIFSRKKLILQPKRGSMFMRGEGGGPRETFLRLHPSSYLDLFIGAILMACGRSCSTISRSSPTHLLISNFTI